MTAERLRPRSAPTAPAPPQRGATGRPPPTLAADAASIIAREQRGAELRAAAKDAAAGMRTKQRRAGRHRRRGAPALAGAGHAAGPRERRPAGRAPRRRARRGPRPAPALERGRARARRGQADRGRREAQRPASRRSRASRPTPTRRRRRTSRPASATPTRRAATARRRPPRSASAARRSPAARSAGSPTRPPRSSTRSRPGITKAFEIARAAVRDAIETGQEARRRGDRPRPRRDRRRDPPGGRRADRDRRQAPGRLPGLRDRFRRAIEERVAKAQAAVNALADGLKNGVQKALDGLGAALDAALGLLEKGLLLMVDGYRAVVAGALKWADGLVKAFAAFAVLVKHVAANPKQWLREPRGVGQGRRPEPPLEGVQGRDQAVVLGEGRRGPRPRAHDLEPAQEGRHLARAHRDDGVGGDQDRDPADADPDPDREADLAPDPGRRRRDADHRDAAGGVGHDPARPRGVRALLRVPQGRPHGQAPARSSRTRSPPPRSPSSTSSPTGCSSGCASPPARSPRSSRRSPRSSARSSRRPARASARSSSGKRKKPKKLKGKPQQEAEARQARQGRAAREGRHRLPRPAARPRDAAADPLGCRCSTRACAGACASACASGPSSATLTVEVNPRQTLEADRGLRGRGRTFSRLPARALPSSRASCGNATRSITCCTRTHSRRGGTRRASTGTHRARAARAARTSLHQAATRVRTRELDAKRARTRDRSGQKNAGTTPGTSVWDGGSLPQTRGYEASATASQPWPTASDARKSQVRTLINSGSRPTDRRLLLAVAGRQALAVPAEGR